MVDCCTTSPPIGNQQKTGSCPYCATAGRHAGRQTVEALVKSEVRDTLNGKAYAFCATPTCPVVYYSPDGAGILKQDVRTRVGIKETDDPIPVCYCFGVTKRMVDEEVERTGRSTASARIRAEVKAGNCRCEVESPSGRCCLNDLIQTEKHALAVRTMRSKLPHHFTSERVDSPWFIGLTVGLMGLAFYLAYRARWSCEPEGTCPPRFKGRVQRSLSSNPFASYRAIVVPNGTLVVDAKEDSWRSWLKSLLP